MAAPGEFDLIRTYFQRPLADAGVRLGIGDDAALLALPPGEELAVTTDTLVAGHHFPDTAAPFDIGWKALAVNLSDLAAMGARARWVTLALTLPASDEAFLGEFARGFFALAEREGVALVGGDTTRGPLSITVTAMGTVPAGQALRRAGARAGDEVYVSGTVGDAGLGLRLELGQWPEALDVAAQALALARLHRPEPRLALGLALRGLATAGLDVSDGLAQDLGHLLAASGVGAELELSALPRSPALAGIDTAFADILALTSGDDYELLFTAPAAARAAIAALPLPCARIGIITAAAGLRFRRDGAAIDMPVAGFTHF
ncbi:MAG: thiamine-phosphate kinase [Pseudomonadota bacterium]